MSIYSVRAFVTTTDELSQNTEHTSVTGTPIIRNLYHNPSIISMDNLIPGNFEPYVDALTIFGCCFENHHIGTQLTKVKTPGSDRLVILQPAKSASTKHVITTSFPRGVGMLWGSASNTSGQNSDKSHFMNHSPWKVGIVSSKTVVERGWCF